MRTFWQKPLLSPFAPKRLACSEFSLISTGRRPSVFSHVRSRHETVHSPLLLELDLELAQIDRQLSLVAQLRPQNLQEERKKFFASETYEPQFVYKPIPKNVIALQCRLKALEIPLGQPLGFLLEEKRNELVAKAELILAIGDDEVFPRQAEGFFGLPPEHVIRAAALSLGKRRKSPRQGRSYTADEAIIYLQAAMKKRGLGHWTVKKKKGIISRCVVAKRNLMFLRAGEKYSLRSLKKLVAHEIETHLYCHENGLLQPYKIFVRGTARSLRTQEGLAIFHQRQILKSAAPSGLLGFHAALFAREHGFRAVYNELCRFVSPVKAWKMVARVKRGMSDAGRPGSTLKNTLYFWGFTEVADFVKRGGSLPLLFSGKCAIDQLSFIAEMKDLRAPKYLPSGLQF